MFAVVEIAGMQYKVSPEEKLFVQRLPNAKGESVKFDKVLLTSDGTKVKVGAPLLSKATVDATILDHVKDDKLIVFKKKKRKGYRVKRGHRQQLSQIQINSITM